MQSDSEILEHILVPNQGGVITEVISSPVKQKLITEPLSQSSQVINPSQPVEASNIIAPIPEITDFFI